MKPKLLLGLALVFVFMGSFVKQLHAATVSAAAEKPVIKNEAAIAAIRKAGEPTTLTEVDASYAQPAADQNATPLYLAAFAAIMETNPTAPAFVASNQKALTLLHQAATRKQCRYPIDLKEGLNTKLPHLVNVKLSTQLLQQEAHIYATKGQMEQATRSILAGLAVSRSLESEPLLISQLVRMRGLGFMVTGLEMALNRKPFSEAQLKQLSAALQTAEEQEEAADVRSLIGERCFCLAAFQSPKQFATVLLGTEESDATSSSEFDQFLDNHGKGPKMQEDLAFYLSHLDSLIKVTKSPFPDKVAAAKAWGAELAKAQLKGYYYSAILLPSLEKFVVKSAVAVAELRVAQTTLAVERYRLANSNKLPDSLQQLVPQYLEAVPADPFDGQPLRFKKNLGKGYTVYSIGPDQQDDKGTPKPAKIYQGLRYDLALTVSR